MPHNSGWRLGGIEARQTLKDHRAIHCCIISRGCGSMEVNAPSLVLHTVIRNISTVVACDRMSWELPLSHPIPSESAELLRSAKDMGKEFAIQSSWL